jgi:hypothetical protein
MLTEAKNDSSLAIDHLSETFLSQEDTCVTWLYCDYRNSENQNPTTMIGGLLRQAVVELSHSSSLPKEALKELLQIVKDKKRLDFDETRSFLIKTMRNFKQSYLCIDGLDECQDSERRSLLQSLKILLGDLRSNGRWIRILLTGRPHVESNVQKFLVTTEPKIPYTAMTLEANPCDISKYVNEAIEKDPSDVPMDDKFKEEIVSEIVASANGMFVDHKPKDNRIHQLIFLRKLGLYCLLSRYKRF